MTHSLLFKLSSFLDKIGRFPALITGGLSGFVLIVLITMTTIDVILRYVFNRPILGVYELSEIFLAIAVFSGVAYTQLNKRHVIIDIAVNRLPPKPRLAVNIVCYALATFLLGILIWYSYEAIFTNIQMRSVTTNLQIPLFPVVGIIPVSFLLLMIVFGRDLVNYTIEALRLRAGIFTGLVILATLILVGVGLALWFSPSTFNLSTEMRAVVSILLLLILFTTGMPIWAAMFISAIVLVGGVISLSTALDSVSIFLYRTVAHYTWASLALFVVLGYLISAFRLSSDLYDTAHKWVGHQPGGLGIATVGASTIAAAVVGDTASSTAAMGLVALPEMKRYKYSLTMSCGAIVSGATIGTLIPPSIAFIIYGVLTMQPIGVLFIAGIMPGLLSASLYSLYIYFSCLRNPSLGPPGPKYGWRVRFTSLIRSIPVIILIMAILGGIYMGVMTPTEAAGVGGAIAILIGVVMRRATRKVLVNALREGAMTCSMIFLILTGASLFSSGILASGLPHALSFWVTESNFSPVVVLISVLMLLFFLGSIIPVVVMLLLTVPIFYPIIMALGYDPIWFGVLCVLMFNIGAMTPPFGMNLFVLKGVAPDVPMATIISGAIPFIGLTLISVTLIVVFPQIALWLPNILSQLR